MGSVVSDERSNGRRQNLLIMEFLLGTFLIATQSLRSSDDRGDGHSNPLLKQPVPDGRVVVTCDRQIWILDESFLGQESLLDRLFRGGREFPRRRSLIGDRESLRIVPIDSQKSEEPRLVDAEGLFDGRTLQQALRAAAQ